LYKAARNSPQEWQTTEEKYQLQENRTIKHMAHSLNYKTIILIIKIPISVAFISVLLEAHI